MIKKRIIKIVAFAAIFLILFTAVSEGMVVSDIKSLTNIKGFYKEPKDTLAVCLIGASETYTGYSAPLAWEEHGYTSYALSVAGVPGNLYKSIMKEAVRTQHPKLVVFEINGFLQEDSYFDRVGKMHTWLDNIPWSKNKMETIEELIPEEEQYSYYFKIATHHDNWKDPKSVVKNAMTKLAIYHNGPTIAKGFGTVTGKMNKPNSGKQTIHFTEKSKGYLDDLLQACKEEGVEQVLFVRFPHERRLQNPEVLDEVASYIEANGYPFLNLNNSFDELGIDELHDFYNAEHLNVYGMEKLTTYLGNYITEHYDVTSSHSDEVCRQWADSASRTGQLRETCKSDIDQGIYRSYSEISFYFPPRNKKEKQSRTEYYMDRLKQAIHCYF